jgi:LmbE family N-acetylglucosaminyl deacetylase
MEYLLQGDSRDIFIAPHCDDVCFSIGYLAWRRQTGTLLTVFSRSGYRARLPYAQGRMFNEVSRLRAQEDRHFADACNLRLVHLDFENAWPPYPAVHPSENVSCIEDILINELLTSLGGKSSTVRPALFCPMGIGLHVDHVGVRTVILKNLDTLSRHYRVVFYEDLYYAADPSRRQAGIREFFAASGKTNWTRLWWSLNKHEAMKIELINLYKSQITPDMKTIKAFTPAVRPGMVAHEAIWTQEIGAWISDRQSDRIENH